MKSLHSNIKSHNLTNKIHFVYILYTLNTGTFSPAYSLKIIELIRVKILSAIVLFLLIVTTSVELYSQNNNTSTQSVTFEMKPISNISVTGNLNSCHEYL